MSEFQTYLYSFELQPLSLELPTPTNRNFVIQWRKGQKIIRSQPLTPKTRLTHLNEILKLCLKLSRNVNGEYSKKQVLLLLYRPH